MHDKAKTFEPIPNGFRMVPHAPSKNSGPYKLLNKLYGGPLTTTIDFVLPNQRFEFVQCGSMFVSSRATVTPVGEQQCRIDFTAAWNILPWLPFAKPLFRYFANIFMKQDKQAMERQAVGLKYKPALMLIDDADTPEHIAVMAGMGLDARIMSGTDDGLKKMIGPAAYVVAAGDAANLPSFDVTVKLDDDEPFERHAGLVMVGNVGQLQGNVQLMPDAQYDDGLLDVFVASPSSVADWVRITTSVILPVPEASEIDRGQGRAVLIECTEPVEYQLDGDAAGECRSMRATVVPQTLTVMVPT